MIGEYGAGRGAGRIGARLLGTDTPEEIIRARPGELAERFTITREDGTPVTVADLPGRRLVRGESAPELLTRSIDTRSGQGFWLLTKATLLNDQGRDYAVNIIEDVTSAKDAELRQRFLDEAGQLLASSLDSTATLRRVAVLAVSFLADWCAIDLPAHDGEAERIADAGTADPAGQTLTVAIPLEDGTSGTLTLGRARRFNDADAAFAQDLALRAATAIQNARLYEAQARVARTLQASLLPECLPTLEGWIGAASYQAGEQGADVGGDFYDIVPATGHRHLVFLGDVTGKGIAAAALTSLVRHSVRTAARFDPNPSKVLALVNEILAEQPELSPVTLVCALIDRQTLTVAAAGHPPPLIKRGPNVKELGAQGVLLGVTADRTYTQHTVELQPGDAVLLYTDGVTDTLGEHTRYGPERLAALFERAPDEPAELLAAIEQELTRFQHGSAIDDRAMLVLRFTGAGALKQAA